jgi:hypothetical protein
VIFIDGFEGFSGAGNPASLLQRAEYVATGTLSSVSGRSSFDGSAALGGGKVSVTRSFPWTTDKFACGIANQFSARGSIMWLKYGTKYITLWMNEDNGLPMLNESAGGALPTITRWYYYELFMNRENNTCELWINNKLDQAIVIDGVVADAATTIEVGLGYRDPALYRPAGFPVYADNGNRYIDDFYARDGDRLGPVIVTTRFPTTDVNVQWFQASTTGNHASNLSQHPPKPLDNYVAGDTVGKEDRFTSGVLLPNTNEILATGLLVMARKADTLNAKLGVFMGGNAGAIAARSAKLTVANEWKTQYAAFEKTGGDTKAGVEASQFGINVATP